MKEQTTRMEAQQREKLALFESQSISLRYDLLRAREQVCPRDIDILLYILYYTKYEPGMPEREASQILYITLT